MRILLIADDLQLGKDLTDMLRNAELASDWVCDFLEAHLALDAGGYALVLLDLDLPGTTGIDLLTRVVSLDERILVVTLSACNDVNMRVRCLDLGADDYVLKPFKMGELLARVRAILRRYSGSATSIGDDSMELNLPERTLAYDGMYGVLSPREFALMRTLMERPGTVFSRADLENRLYGWRKEMQSNVVEFIIHSLRRKFGATVIRNARGRGWMVILAHSQQEEAT